MLGSQSGSSQCGTGRRARVPKNVPIAGTGNHHSQPRPSSLILQHESPQINMSTQGPDHTTPSMDACPVDEKTRLAWMKANPGMSRPGAPPAPAATNALKANGCDSEEIDQSPASVTSPPGLFSRWFSSAPAPAADASAPTSAQQPALGTQRVVSTIPRASPVNEDGKPANSEKESGVSESGNWIYPSEKMFFDAMKRKVRQGRI